ncbi:hypothetical protein [Pantoea dispersa]|uniref:hypothetical protein n=1 Tax=Pantoea dispersa TaxID=59814 RepID=UPI003215B12A
MCKCDEILFERLSEQFENIIKESKAFIKSETIREFRRVAHEYSTNVYNSEPCSDESFGDQGISSHALVEAKIHGNFDSLLRCAFISEQLGKYSFDNYDEPNESVSHLCDALFLLNLWLGVKVKERFREESIEIEVNKRLKAREDGRDGGKERAKKFLPVKVELIRLLFDKVPSQGWGSIGEAISAIEIELFNFIEINVAKGQGNANYRKVDNVILLWDNLSETIHRWAKEDEIVKSVFDSVAMP